METYNILAQHGNASVISIADCADVLTPARLIAERIDHARTHEPHKKIIVLIGEWHNQPSHVLLGNTVAALCQQKGYKIGVVLEKPHNHHAILANKLFRYNLNAQQSERIRKQDTTYRMSLNGNLAHSYQMTFASIARQHSIYNHIQSDYPVACVDLCFLSGRRSKDTFDLSDAYTRQIVQDIIPDEDYNSTLIYEAAGIKARNYGMSVLIEQFYEAHKPDVIIMQTGLTHVHGRPSINALSADSLSSIFNNGHDWKTISACCLIDEDDVSTRSNGETLFLHGLNYAPILSDKVKINEIRPYIAPIMSMDTNLTRERKQSQRTYKAFVRSCLRDYGEPQPGILRRLLPF